MPVALDHLLGANIAAAAASVAVTCPAAVPVGDAVIVIGGWQSDTPTVASASDSKGNAYTQATWDDSASQDTQLGIWAAEITTALTTTDTVTWTSGGTAGETSGTDISAASFTGIRPAGAYAQGSFYSNHPPGFSVPYSVTTSANVQAKDLVIAAFITQGSPCPVPATPTGWQALSSDQPGSSMICGFWQLAPGGSTVICASTTLLSSNNIVTGVIAAIPASSTGVTMVV